MFEFWFLGVVTAYLISAGQLLHCYFVIGHEPWRSNLAKIDLAFDLNLQPVDVDFRLGRSLVLWLVFGIPLNSLLLSWIQASIGIFILFKGIYSKKALRNAPPEVKELDWSIRNTNLSREQMLTAMRELATRMGDQTRLAYLDEFEGRSRHSQSAS